MLIPIIVLRRSRKVSGLLCILVVYFPVKTAIYGHWSSTVCVFWEPVVGPLAQIKFLRHLLGVTKLDKEKNQCVREKTVAQNIVKEIKQYQKKWLQHVQRMDTNRIPKQALQYRTKGRRNIGRPKKRWRDQLHFEDQGTGNSSNPSWTW